MFDAAFLRRLVWAMGATPACLLAWDAARHALGVNAVDYAIRTTGLLTLIFLTLALLVTPLRKLTGFAALVAPRRSLGLFAFFYLVLHFALFFGFNRGASVSSTVHEIVMRRYLQLGTLGLLLMIPLALTSTDAMVRRLGAKRWKRLHRLAYVVTALGCVHYVLLVKADVRQPLALGAVVALLLAYRAVGAIARQAKRDSPSTAPRKPWSGELRVAEVRDETPDVRTFRLALPDGGELPFAFAPGQHLQLGLTIGGARVRRSYTIASSANERAHCEITVKRVPEGRVSRHLHEAVRVGDRLTVTAPVGSFVFEPTAANDVVTLVGGGVGITPLMAIVRTLVERGWAGRIELVLSMKTERDVPFAAELAELAQRAPNLRVTTTLTQESSDAWAGRRGHLGKEPLAEILGERPRGPVFLCGPEAMMTAVREALRALGVSEDDVRTEKFGTTVTAGSDDGGEHDVTFERQELVVAGPRRLTLLEVAESAGVELPFECRAGVCGQCKVKLLDGEVTMASEEALSTAEKLEGIVLACQARPKTAVVVDA